MRGDTAALGSKDRVRVQVIPVRREDRLIGLVTREESMTLARRSGELERTYFEVFDRFARMIADGTFPFDVDEVEMESARRVGDGVIVIDAETRVKFASPNAVSSLHRMGIHTYAQTQRLIDIGFDDDAARERDASAPPGRRGDRARRRFGARAGSSRWSIRSSRPVRSC